MYVEREIDGRCNFGITQTSFSHVNTRRTIKGDCTLSFKSDYLAGLIKSDSVKVKAL